MNSNNLLIFKFFRALTEKNIQLYVACALLFLTLVFAVLPSKSIEIYAQATSDIPTPKDSIGFEPGEDRKLANWNSIVNYYQRVEKASDRIIVREIGKSTLGKPFIYAVISSPENLMKLPRYIEINKKLADPRLIGRSEEAAKNLIKGGKTFVLITHGIHSNEVGSTLSSLLTTDKLIQSNDPRIEKILDETIIIIVPSLNPDGVDIVKNWYDKTLNTKYEGTLPPELYHKYVGHDLNRDWYAFTQKETRLTAKYIHNVYHPQIVHDIHQQGSNGARFFVPPFLDPIEPNVPKEIIEGYTDLGNYIAKQMRNAGFEGITTNSTYDAWTPARAYSHYHGGVRILSETASAKLATPIEVKYRKLGSRRGYDAKKVSANFGPIWKGGKWDLRDITSYMTNGALFLLENAAIERENWLKRFYEIGYKETRPRTMDETNSIIVTNKLSNRQKGLERLTRLRDILETAGVKSSYFGKNTRIGNREVKAGSLLIKMAQPYGNFARALLLPQEYPDLVDEKGVPIPPYDVTAHSLPLLFGLDVFTVVGKSPENSGNWFLDIKRPKCSKELVAPQSTLVYKSNIPSMDRGWLNWLIDEGAFRSFQRCSDLGTSISDKEIRAGNFEGVESIVFPDMGSAWILNGFRKGTMPREYTGGIGKSGVRKLSKFVSNGGRLVFLNRSADFAIKNFSLPVVNLAPKYKRKDFFIPGSILRLELEPNHPLSADMPTKTIAWFERSPVFAVTDSRRVRVIGRFPENKNEILLSGGVFGVDKIAGKPAALEVSYGKGSIILLGFRPHYRGQSLETLELLDRAMNERKIELK